VAAQAASSRYRDRAAGDGGASSTTASGRSSPTADPLVAPCFLQDDAVNDGSSVSSSSVSLQTPSPSENSSIRSPSRGTLAGRFRHLSTSSGFTFLITGSGTLKKGTAREEDKKREARRSSYLTLSGGEG
jgi:hypothetical protein